jgi:hypothetical protein
VPMETADANQSASHGNQTCHHGITFLLISFYAACHGSLASHANAHAALHLQEQHYLHCHLVKPIHHRLLHPDARTELQMKPTLTAASTADVVFSVARMEQATSTAA